MNTYSIADLTVNMEAKGKTVAQAEKYLIPPLDNTDITLTYNPEGCARVLAQHPEIPEESYIYMLLGKRFAESLLDFDGFILHSSAVAYKNKAYLFSADSGVGKSTHTNLWKQCFSGAEVINDDKPALRLIDDVFYAYGTPFSGSTPINLNVRVPLKAICFIERAEKNYIERITNNAEIIKLIFPQTLRQVGSEKAEKLLTIIGKLVEKIPFYKLHCLPNEDAAKLAYEVMSK